MTNPGFMGQQAAQQAAASARNAAMQQASRASQQTVRHASSLNHQTYHPARGVVGRLFTFVFGLVTFAVALGILLLILSQAQPQWYHQILTWLHHLS
ncbi:hypothetical protein OG738_40750 [Amycolatopsis sp. NBC_01488]|uniref:hypothetical protein n=1 Tax=Amycolatopsis sp. NBC_01488 TaxID=2903563 RepID=UPI002E2B69CE|nr:hypothetical protein [Amycolatopsis sp. NBC_01488]